MAGGAGEVRFTLTDLFVTSFYSLGMFDTSGVLDFKIDFQKFIMSQKLSLRSSSINTHVVLSSLVYLTCL